MIRIRLMTPDDLPLAMRLKAQAGWNQLEADWRRFLSMQPDGCFVAEFDGRPAATTVACAFGPVAWLAMVLVDEPLRGRGVGTAIVRHALQFLDQIGAHTVRLDATPLGRPVYEKLGFSAEYELARYEGDLPAEHDGPPPAPHWPLRAARAEDYACISAFDRSIVGADRGKFLFRLFGELPDEVRWCGDADAATGYATVRPGSNAMQIGPCVAAGEIGAVLLADAANRHAGQRAVIDVPLVNPPAVRLVEAIGLERRRLLLRMRRGPAVGEDATKIWASSGPELG